MNRGFLAAALAPVLALAGPAFAQQSDTQSRQALVEVEDEAMTVAAFDISVDRLEDTDVFDGNGEQIGEVEEVLMTPAGEVQAVAVELGGFLGMGDREVVASLDRLRMDGDRLVTDMTAAEIEALPVWDD